MNSFTIVCTTCQSRIRVRRAELLGQLANCPKCHSIVKITPPRQVRIESDSPGSVDSRALTQEDIELAGRLPEVAAESVGDGADTAAPPATTPPVTTEADRAIEPSQASGSRFVTERIAPSVPWTSRQTARSRQIVLVAFLGTAGVVLSVLGFMAFLRWFDRSRSRAPVAVVEPAQATAVESEPLVPEETAEGQTAELDLDSSRPSLDLSSDANSQASPTTADTDHETVAATSTAAGSIVEVLPTIPEEQSGGELANHGDASDASAPPPGVKPIDLDSVIADQPMDAEPAVELPKRIRELYDFIAEPFQLAIPQQVAVPDQAPATAEELGLNVSTSDKSPPPIDLHALADQRMLRGFRVDDATLPRAVNLWNLVSGIPTTVDLDSLLAANWNRDQRFSFVLDSGTVARAARQFSQHLGLNLQAVENRSWRLSASPPDDSLLPRQMEVSDLIHDDQQAAWLLGALEQFFPGSRDQVTLNSEFRLDRSQQLDDRVWFAIVRLLENWRLHAGLKPRLAEYPIENWRTEFVTAAELPGLRHQLTDITASATPLASLLSSQCGQAGLTCWVDWPALQQVGLTPQSLVVSLTQNRPLIQLLREFEFEYGTQTALVDSKTIWVTTPREYRQSARYFVFPANEKGLEDYWRIWLRPLTPLDGAGISQLELALTPDQRFLWVKCCFPTLAFGS